MLEQTGQYYSESTRPSIGRLQWTVAASLLLSLSLLSAPGLAADSLQGLVDKGNDAANRQDYPVAVQLYEQAIQKAPGESALKNNLAVLYTNYGVSLQEQKQYEAAIRQFDKALALMEAANPRRKNILEAKAGTYYTQAMNLRDEAQNAAGEAKPDYPRIRALLEQAIAVDPDAVTYRKGLAGIYLDEAYQLATAEKYAEAIPLLEKSLSIDPQNANAKLSLANVYLGMAKNDEAKRQEWIDKALATDDSPRIRQVAERLQSGKPENKAGFLAQGSAKISAPVGISKLSVSDMLRDMEVQLKIEPPKDATLLARLETLEKQVLGKTQDGALATRTKTVYTQLMGSYDALNAGTDPNQVQASMSSPENSYLEEIFKVTDGKVIRWGKFPLRVYIETPAKDSTASALFQDDFKEAARKGLNAWKTKTDGFVNYVEIQNPDAADIIVGWADQYVDRFADPEKIPPLYKNYTPPKRNPLMNVFSVVSALTPGYYSLAPQALNAAMQYKLYKKLDALREESRITLGLEPTKGLPKEAAQTLIQNMTAKEFGHALGLKGSSSQAGDLLYPELRSDIAQLPSPRDLATLQDLYNRPPNIILNVR
jgi:tetratricopeptide (TPR) repeat protein